MMGLINRKKQHQHSKSEDPSDQTENSSLKTRDDCNNNVVKQFFIALLLAPVLYYTFVIASSIREADISRQNARKYDFNWSQERDGLSLIINFGSDDDVSGLPYNLGPHRVAVSLYREQDLVNCQDNLPVRLRIIGDALLEIPLSKSESYIKEEWKYEDYLTGSFSLPIEGSYKVEATWEGCAAGSPSKETREYDFKVVGKKEYTPKIVDGVSFTNGAWIAAGKVKYDKIISASPSFTGQQYLWADPVKVAEGKEMTVLEGREKSIVLKESIVADDTSFYEFTQLSNYEVVCWIGSKSAEDIWGSFKSLRGQLFPHQRPFKFHYYQATSFTQPDPDKGWSTSFRKCKHILISLDEPDEPLSQLEYKNQVTTFINHLLNAFDEERTFPALIWMFTTMESPVDTKNCHDAYMARSSTEHPCNVVLKSMFRSSPLPSQVRLLDNTDLTSTKMGEDRESILAAIALRVFVIVGHQVKAWRDEGQVGGLKGLTKNGVTESNYELVSYDWT